MPAKKNSVRGANKRGRYVPDRFLSDIHEKLLKEAKKTNPFNRKLTFSKVRQIMGNTYRIRRDLHFKFLKSMQSLGMIRIKPYHYVLVRDLND